MNQPKPLWFGLVLLSLIRFDFISKIQLNQTKSHTFSLTVRMTFSVKTIKCAANTPSTK